MPDFDEPLGKDAPCPSCGADGGSHETIGLDGHQVGRRCFACGATWPIAVRCVCPTCTSSRRSAADA
jgi:uncharacterized Zn finger protein